MIHGHGGNVYALAAQLGCPVAQIMDMSSNINPLGMMPGLKTVLKTHLDDIAMLPEADGGSAAHAVASLMDIDPETILAGNGTTQFIYLVCPAIQSKRVLIVGPTYADYADACRANNIDPNYYLLDADTSFTLDIDRLRAAIRGHDTVFVCNPNNPTAGMVDPDQFKSLYRSYPKVRFIIDESYLPFVKNGRSASMVDCGMDNVMVLWSASKIFGLPGLRAGFLIATRPILSKFERLMQPWCLNSLAQAAMVYLGRERERVEQFIQNTQDYLEKERHQFTNTLTNCPQLTLYPSVTSYILMQLPAHISAADMCRDLGAHRILIRNCSNFHGLSHRFVRIALKSSEVNQIASKLIVQAMGESGPRDQAHALAEKR